MDHAQLIQGFSDQIKVADAHFLVSVVELLYILVYKSNFLDVKMGSKN